jgi:hypothetical protein
MDWIRSEDLKEEKVITAPSIIIAGPFRTRVTVISCAMKF